MSIDSAKTIICYGDSNTWGAVPGTDQRYSRDIRWPSVLQKHLGSGYEVISEGLCGRTLKSDKSSPELNGITYVLPCMFSHEPVDRFIIMLGTNDVNDKYQLSPDEIANNLLETISIIRNAEMHGTPKILIICPPRIIASDNGWHESFIEGMEKIRKLPELYKKVAAETNSTFIDANDSIVSSKIDGIHLDESEQLKLAKTVYDALV